MRLPFHRPRSTPARKPTRTLPTLLAAFLFATAPLGAVQSDGSYVTTPPTVANWNSGWGSDNVTGWDYLGQVNGATGVYLGNNWVLTAAHVGAGTFTLSGTAFSFVAGTAHTFTSGSDTADLSLFQIASGPALPSLILAGTSQSLVGNTVVMTGFGGGQGKTWGANTITKDNILVTIDGYPYATVDFETDFGGDNKAVLVVGDSGGGDFIDSGGQWLLAGVNEAVDDHSGSYMVQLSAYADTINPIIAVPEPGAEQFLGVGLCLGLLCLRKRQPLEIL